jgi:Cdc6-like AAA superfamily ATPase
MAAVQGGVNELLHAQHDQEHETILKWLTPINGIDYNSQQNDYIMRRQHGTGQWFLESREFQTWLNTDNQTLFCPGIPGAGKTIMTSIIIEYLQSNYTDSNIAYIYCNIELRDKQIPTVMLESVLKQLVQKQSPLPQGVKDLYERHKGKQSRPRLQELSEVLQSVISPGSRTFIIIDALDECQNHDKCRSKLLSEIFTLQNKTQLNLLATSRPQEVEATFSGCISREIHATREDINAYLDEQISLWDTSHHDTIDKDLRDMIKSEISSAANEM